MPQYRRSIRYSGEMSEFWVNSRDTILNLFGLRHRTRVSFTVNPAASSDALQKLLGSQWEFRGHHTKLLARKPLQAAADIPLLDSEDFVGHPERNVWAEKRE
jgi:hypothetical protein